MTWYPFVSYDPVYPKLFEAEKGRIRKVLKDAIVEHFGSTSVEGLGGKGYIDIYVVVPKDNVEKTSELIQTKLGYEFKPNAGNAERLFHQRKVENKNGNLRVYHLHLTYVGNKGFRKDIGFRNILRSDPQKAKKYAEVKKLASVRANQAKDKRDAKEAYMRIKEPVIKEIIGV